MLQLRMLGSPAITDASGGTPPGLGPGKVLALLCYLAREGSARREELMALLWGDADEARARNAFRQTLHRLRGALGPELVPPDQDPVRLEPAGRMRADVDAFEEAIEAGRPLLALERYGGPFLDGFTLGEPGFDHWADGERARLRARYVGVLADVARDALARGDAAEAIRWSGRWLEAEPFDVEAALEASTALIGAGRRSEAAALLRGFNERTVRELGGAPPAETVSALARLSAETRPEPTAGPSPSAAPRRPPLVGREAELARLLGAWREVLEGDGSTWVLTGEAGSGKTRLAEELRASVVALGPVLALEGAEHAGSASLPYASVAEALRGAVRAPGLAGASEHLLAEAARLLPELRDRYRLPAAPAIEDDAARLRFFEGVASVLEAVAYEQPVLLLLEDLHHAAPSTLDLVRFLAARLRGSAVLVLTTFRTDRQAGAAPPGSAGPRDLPFARVVPLGPLSDADVAGLLETIPGSERIGAAWRERIVATAGGSPARVLELARRAGEGEPLSTLPAGPGDLYRARLERLPPSQRRLFLAASLLGRPVPLRVLAAAAHLSEPATLDAALALESAGLLVQSEAGIGVGSDAAAQIAVERAGAAGRALMAGWVADALAATGSAPQAEVARLYALAGRGPETYRAARTAAEEAIRVGAWKEAADLLRLALPHAPHPRDRARIESWLDVLGAGRPRLPASLHEGDTADAAPDAAPAASAPAPLPAWSVRPRLVAALVVVVALSVLATVGTRLRTGAPPGHVLADTVLLAEPVAPGRTAIYGVSGPVAQAQGALVALRRGTTSPAWADSVAFPWMNPIPAPGGGHVALERMAATGPDLYLASGDGSDTVALARGEGDDLGLGWSPDGRWLLVSRSRLVGGEIYDTDLYAFPVDGGGAVPLDTAPERAVVEARWSPDGTHVAWAAREHPSNQQDIFVSQPDGRRLRNLTGSGAEERHLAWSADGSRIAYTGDADGNAEIYAVDIAGGGPVRLTHDPGHDDHAAFSPDGRFVAFESTRAGEPAVFVVASRGGEPARLSPEGRRMTLAGWGGGPPPHVARLRIRPPAGIRPGAAGRAGVEAILSDGTVRSLEAPAEWASLDRDVAEVRPSPGGRGAEVHGRRPGIARLVARAGALRSDTAFVKIGAQPVELAVERFEPRDGGGADWIAVGATPSLGGAVGRGGTGGAALGSPGHGAAGLLSARSYPLAYGLGAELWLRAPLASPVRSLRRITFALVDPAAGARPGPAGPDADPLAAITWIGEAGRIEYSAERESWMEPVHALPGADAHLLRIQVEADGRIAFYVDGRLRWRSTARVATQSDARRARVWIGSRGSGEGVVVDDLAVWAGDARPR